MCRDRNTCLDLGFSEQASELQATEGRKDLSVEVGRNGDVTLRDTVSDGCRQR